MLGAAHDAVDDLEEHPAQGQAEEEKADEGEGLADHDVGDLGEVGVAGPAVDAVADLLPIGARIGGREGWHAPMHSIRGDGDRTEPIPLTP